MYKIAKELSKEPDDILDWQESDFYLWLAVSADLDRDQMLERSMLTSYAVWQPSKVPKLLDRKDPMSEEEIQEALDKAEKHKNLDYKETT